MIEKHNLMQSFSLRNVLRKYPIWIGLLLLCIALGILEPRFFSGGNISNLLRQAVPLGLGAVGMGIVVIAGGFDLCLGSTAAMTSVVMVVGVWAFGTIPGIILGLLAGSVVGFFNGVLVGRLRLNSLIATLGTMIGVRGLAFYITGGVPFYGNMPESMRVIGNGFVGPVPIPVIVAGAGFLVMHFLLTRTALGRRFYAVGGNREAARLAGLNLVSTTVLAFIICGVFAAMAGVILTSRLSIGAPNLAQTLMLEALGAVVIGGVSMSGGEGNALGALAGVLFLSIIRNGLNLHNASQYVINFVTGLVIIVAIIFDRYRYR